MSEPIFDQVIAGLRYEWSSVDPATIAPEWWMALLGYEPEDPTEPGDLILAIIALLDAQTKVALDD